MKPEYRLKHIDEVHRVLMKAGVTIKLRTCHFYSKSSDFLGHVFAPGKLQVA